MEAFERQQFDLLLAMSAERLAERAVHRCGGPDAALAQLRADPQGEGVWLDEFARAVFRDFLLDSPAGACFVLQALAGRSAAPPPAGSVAEMLGHMALRVFADLLGAKVEELLEQQAAYA
jgi:hypothetical protein